MPRQPSDTKSRILNVTRTLYSTHGCENTTIEDIISAIGITKGAFYHYFKSKEQLCETVIEEVISDYKNLTESIDANAEPIEQLQQIILKLSKLNASGHWVNCRLITRLSADPHEAYPKIQRKISDFWRWYADFYEQLIEKAQQAGQLNSSMEPKLQAQLLTAVMAGAVMLEKVEHSKPARTELCGTLIKLLKP